MTESDKRDAVAELFSMYTGLDYLEARNILGMTDLSEVTSEEDVDA